MGRPMAMRIALARFMRKPGMDIMRVSIVVRDNRNMLIPRIVERFAQQRRIVGKAAITDVFSRANSDIGIVVLTAFERGERFTDYDLGRETICRCARIACQAR